MRGPFCVGMKHVGLCRGFDQYGTLECVRPYERSVFYYILIQALPIVVIEGGPLLVLVFAVTEYVLRREMKGKGR